MTKIDEFIKLLESNKATHNDKKSFLESLTKKEFISFLSKDFSSDTFFSDLFSVLGEKKLSLDEVDNHSIEARTDLFEEYINQTESIINQFTLSELKKAYPKIKPEYTTIKNMFLERIILLIHNSKERIDIKKLIEFKKRIEKRTITHDDIRSILLRMTNEEFSFFICIDSEDNTNNISTISTQDIELENMYEYQAPIIAEIIESYTEEEIIELIPLISNSSNRIRKMFFKCLNEKKASELFLTNAPKYSNDIYNYVLSPTLSDEKDKLIVEMLSNPQLYSLYSESDIAYLKALIANGEVFLDENSNIINTHDEDIIAEAAKHIANIKGRDKPNIKRGILKKLCSKKLYELLIEVNKGLLNINEDEITIEELISLMEMPIDKAILFLEECLELTEENKKRILRKLYKDNEYQSLSIKEAKAKIIEKHLQAVINRLHTADANFDYVYKDLLEIEYNKELLDKMLEEYSKSFFVKVPKECMNILLSQIIEREKETIGIDIKKDFYTGRTYTPTQPKITTGTYNQQTKTISINTNVFSELLSINKETDEKELTKQFIYIMAMIENVFHEIRHAYQIEAVSYVSNMKDFYFMLDNLLHQEQFIGTDYYDANYKEDSREIDAELYAKISTAQLLKNNPSVKEYYWKINSSKAKELAKKRKAPQLRKESVFNEENERKNIVDFFFEHISSERIIKLKENYPMLDLIVDEYGNRLSPSDIQSMIKELERIITTDDISDEDYEQGEIIINFLAEYLKKVHNKKAVRKKLI